MYKLPINSHIMRTEYGALRIGMRCCTMQFHGPQFDLILEHLYRIQPEQIRYAIRSISTPSQNNTYYDIIIEIKYHYDVIKNKNKAPHCPCILLNRSAWRGLSSMEGLLDVINVYLLDTFCQKLIGHHTW